MRYPFITRPCESPDHTSASRSLLYWSIILQQIRTRSIASALFLTDTIGWERSISGRRSTGYRHDGTPRRIDGRSRAHPADVSSMLRTRHPSSTISTPHPGHALTLVPLCCFIASPSAAPTSFHVSFACEALVRHALAGCTRLAQYDRTLLDDERHTPSQRKAG